VFVDSARGVSRSPPSVLGAYKRLTYPYSLIRKASWADQLLANRSGPRHKPLIWWGSGAGAFTECAACKCDFLAGKARRLKQAKEEAQQEIEIYRQECEKQYREHEARVSSSSSIK